MKHPRTLFLAIAATFGLAASCPAVVLLDDTFADGIRTNQNFPTDSAWFSSAPTFVSTSAGRMSITNKTDNTSSHLYTYFTTNGTVVQLANVGNTLKAEVSFTVVGMPVATNTSKNLRFGLYNSLGNRTTLGTDASIPGNNYYGYASFCIFSPWFSTSTSAFDVRKRTTSSNADPMNASADSPILGSGGADTNTPAFTNNGQYKFTLILSNAGPTMVVSEAWTGGGLTNAFSATDSNTVASSTTLWTNFDTLEIRLANASGTATNFVFTEIKITGPPAIQQAPSILVQPAGQTLTVADFAFFSVAAGGAQPLTYQWRTNTVPVANATNAFLLLTNIQTSQAADYTLVITNSLGSITSDVATLTVNLPPTPTSRGLVLDDTWVNPNRSDPSISSTHSFWVASLDASLQSSSGSMVGTPDAATSRMWVGYYENALASAPPVHLAVGDAIKATMVFTPTGVAPKNTSSLRFGLFDYSDGASPLSQDGNNSTPVWSGNSAGASVRGYLLTANFGTNFGDNTPLGIQVRTNISSVNLMGSTADFLSLGSGPSGMSNAPGFSDGTQYTLELTVARADVNKAQVTAKITGGALNILWTDVDPTFGTHRFDSFAIRPNRTTDSAASFNFTEFKVEVVEPPLLPFSITRDRFVSPGQFALTWGPSVYGRTYQVQSTPSLSPPAWITNATVTATDSTTSWTNSSASGGARFYRVWAP